MIGEIYSKSRIVQETVNSLKHNENFHNMQEIDEIHKSGFSFRFTAGVDGSEHSSKS